MINFPTGQGGWHIHDSERPWFDHLEERQTSSWDGHCTQEKYRRLEGVGDAVKQLMRSQHAIGWREGCLQMKKHYDEDVTRFKRIIQNFLIMDGLNNESVFDQAREILSKNPQ